MRRSSILRTQTSEPLIVVEDDEYEEEKKEDSRQNSEDEYSLNPYLLSPYAREIRKHSLPTPQCSGITASQVRRLSERGETVGPGPNQVEFLATLSTAPQPSPGGRRHSVVTISRVPTTLFGRNRRESVAAFPSQAFAGRVLPNRRESIACPPSTEPRGSIHNLQLDIMDDIVQARKVRMKMWGTSNEKVCEVQPLDDSGNVQRYTNSGRRFSDFVGTTLTTIPSLNKRRASELPPSPIAETSFKQSKNTGIVCSNNDLINILSSLSTSATEINQEKPPERTNVAQQKRSQLRSSRSNSFDISILNDDPISKTAPSNWFVKRHQPITKTDDKPASIKEKKEKKTVIEKEPNKLMWDERSGSLVDPQALGSAIEVFLRKASPSDPPGTSTNMSPTKTVGEKNSGMMKTAKSWFNKGDEESSSTEACDSSICSTLKDLFVK
ncbi:uncharacterized protein LOC130450042 [Diorhabda sublineata]|uniref:uncharacterized protein LOC130450042 n=1 Tax=Diorhabda sublineata TaxID=1163346 RepID=UPI0024E07F32|nr:uncharacterized protein LOC130450042 [Diorhabda sublineata]